MFTYSYSIDKYSIHTHDIINLSSLIPKFDNPKNNLDFIGIYSIRIVSSYINTFLSHWTTVYYVLYISGFYTDTFGYIH